MHTLTIPLSLIVAFLACYVLVVGKAVLVPLVIALFLWYLINALADIFREYVPGNALLPFVASIGTLGVAVWIPIDQITSNIPRVVQAAPLYQANFERLITQLFHFLNLDHTSVVNTIKSSVDLPSLAKIFASAAADIAGNILLIMLYIIFLLLEQGKFNSKIAAMSRSKKQEKNIQKILHDIYARVRTYIWLKTLVSLITSLASLVVMWSVDLDYAGFWAVLIFFFNFIPNIGSLLATLFPALLALVQFDTLSPFLIVAGGISAIQVLVGNILEPRLMGNSLNLSPMIILLSLVFWGSIWGITGMYMAVPLMVVITIVLGQFPATRPVAIFLSQDGKVS